MYFIKLLYYRKFNTHYNKKFFFKIKEAHMFKQMLVTKDLSFSKVEIILDYFSKSHPFNKLWLSPLFRYTTGENLKHFTMILSYEIQTLVCRCQL